MAGKQADDDRSYRRRWAVWGLALVGPLVLIAGALAAVVATPWGLRAAKPLIEEAIAGAVDGSAEIAGLEGTLWHGFQAERIAIDGADGLAVRVDRLRLDWTPAELFDRVLRIDLLAADRLALTLPAAGENEEEVSAYPGLPQLPVAVRLGRLDLAEVALRTAPGEPEKRVTVHGDLSLARNIGGAAELHLKPLDATGDRLDARAAFDPAANTLDLDIDLRAAADGMLWGVAGVPPAQAGDAEVRLAGSGPLDRWQGRLHARAAGYGRLDSDVTMRFAEGQPLGLAVDGEARPAQGLLPAGFQDLAETVGFRLEGRLDGTERADISQLSLRLGDLATIGGSAAVDLAGGTLDAEATVDAAPALAGRLDPDLAWKQATLDVRAEGQLVAPVLSLKAGFTGIAYAGFAAERLTARLEPEDAAMQRFLVAIEATGADWGEPTLNALLGPTPGLTADGRRAGDLIALRNVDLTAGQLTAKSEADVDLDAPKVTGITLDAQVDRLGSLPAITGIVESGAVEASLANASWSAEAGFVGDLRVAGRDIGYGADAAAAFAGPSPSLTGRLTYDSAGALTANGLRLEAAGGTLEGRAALDAAMETLDVALDGTLAPGPLKQIAEIEPAAPLDVSLSLAGPPAQPTGKLAVRWQRLQVPGESLGAGHVTTRLVWPDGVPAADVDAAVDWRGRQVTTTGRVLAQDDALAVERLVMESGGMRASGHLRLPDYAPPAAGELSLADVDLALLRTVAGADVAGRASGTVTLAARDGGQAVELELEGRQLRHAPPEGPALSVATLGVEAEIADALAARRGTAHVIAHDVERGEIRIARVQADFAGNLTDARLDLVVESDVPDGKATAHLALAQDKAGQRLTLRKLDGSLAGRSFALIEPATLTLPAAGGLTLQASLRAEDGRLKVRYEEGRRTVADVEIERFPLAILPTLDGRSITAGRLDASAHLEESADGETKGNARVRLAGLAVSMAEDLPPLSATAEASLERGVLDARLTVDNEALKEARATARLPVDISLAHVRFGLAERGRIEGDAVLCGALEDVWGYLQLPTHKVEGGLDAIARVRGTVTSPVLEGRIGLAGGRYESLEWGTLLQDVTAKARFTDRRLVIEELTASDGKDGRVEVSGETVFGGSDRVRYDVTATARNLLAVRRDDVSARATADLDFTGKGGGGTLAGKVTVNGAEINLNAALPPSVPTLQVTRANGAPPAEEPPQKEANGAGEAIALDVRIAIPGQVFARGRRVDSEWEGNLHVTGTADEPKINGNLGVKRGTLGLLNKDLTLDETEILFQGRTPINPDLSVRAVHDDKDLRAVVRVDGTMQQPKFELTSTPSLPRDEILARMLFGKSRGKLSALEAAQLAAALNELRSGGSGVDVLGTLRSVAGLDRLSVGSTEEGGAELEAGRYFTDNVYVGAKQGTTPGTAGVEVEVEVTPNISVTTETGQTGKSNVGVNFKWDY